MFSTRPPSRARSRSGSSGGGGAFGAAAFPISGFTSLNSKEGFNEASSKIRQAMAERGQLRRRRSGGGGTGLSSDGEGEGEGDGSIIGESEDGWEEAKKVA